MAFILYVIVCFGIFGTVLMMTEERMYEFGVLLSIGMNRIKLYLIILLETIMLSSIGVIIGIRIGTTSGGRGQVGPIVGVLYFNNNAIYHILQSYNTNVRIYSSAYVSSFPTFIKSC